MENLTLLLRTCDICHWISAKIENTVKQMVEIFRNFVSIKAIIVRTKPLVKNELIEIATLGYFAAHKTSYFRVH